MRIYAAADDLNRAQANFQDVTEGVQALYDLAVNSMDYGSGFWSYEDAAPVAALAEKMGWGGAEGLRKYADDKLHETEAAAWAQDNGFRNYEDWFAGYTQVTRNSPDGSTTIRWVNTLKPHEHVFSTAGRCMWYQCPEKEER